jgi:predicted AAA+ superfamily ATPase
MSGRTFLAEKLCKFYANNPDEELSYSDIRNKFGVTLESARSCVYRLKQRGVLETTLVVRAKPQERRVT